MEIIKNKLKANITKVLVGTDYQEGDDEMVGSVELDIENQSQFVEVINGILEDEKAPRILVDIQNISYIDSSGLWALFEGHKKAIQQNGKLVLLSPSKDVKRVLDITKMSSKMDIFDTEEDAINYLEG